MAQRLALAVIPGTGWRATEIRSVAHQAEAAGFEAIFAAEVNVDVLAVAQLMGDATSTIKLGSWIANIYLRHSYICAKHAALIADATGGRMIPRLGVSHQPRRWASACRRRPTRCAATPPRSPAGCVVTARPLTWRNLQTTRCRYILAQ